MAAATSSGQIYTSIRSRGVPAKLPQFRVMTIRRRPGMILPRACRNTRSTQSATTMRVTIETIDHNFESSKMALRHAGEDAGRKVVDALRKSD